MVFEECFNRWWAIKQLNLTPLTIAKNEMSYQNHLLPVFGKMELSEITDMDIVNFANQELKHGNRLTHGPLAPISVQKLVGAIKEVFEYAIEKKLVESNPCAKIKIKRSKVKKIEVFSEDEIEALVQCATPDWLSDMILLAYRTGMRRGEIYGLQWDDINFQEKTLKIQRTVAADSYGNIHVNVPKTRKSNRKILLDGRSIQMLQRRYDTRLWPESEWVFTGRNGKQLSPLGHTRFFHNACDAANVPYRTFHCIRHSHITWLLNQGVPVKLVSERVGHANATVTLGTYAHYIPDTQSTVLDVINGRLQVDKSNLMIPDGGTKPHVSVAEQKQQEDTIKVANSISDEIAALNESILEAKRIIEKCSGQIQECEFKKEQLEFMQGKIWGNQ